MTRILEPGQIEAFAGRTVARVRLPGTAGPFGARARRLRQLATPGGPGHSIADYLNLMAAVADGQALALERFAAVGPSPNEIARARTHRMPVIHATGWPRVPAWRELALQLAADTAAAAQTPGQVREIAARLRSFSAGQLEEQADALLAARLDGIDLAGAPFLMAALQVHWVALARRLAPDVLAALDVPGVCPACGTLPVASVVRTDQDSQGHRYLHCALCATEWHLVRVTCSQCQSAAQMAYHSIEGGSAAIRAESCEECHTYRKILYQEKDPDVEPVADDLASLGLDLLMAEAGYHRGSGNPLLWQAA
jgi:FdhE protein